MHEEPEFYYDPDDTNPRAAPIYNALAEEKDRPAPRKRTQSYATTIAPNPPASRIQTRTPPLPGKPDAVLDKSGPGPLSVRISREHGYGTALEDGTKFYLARQPMTDQEMRQALQATDITPFLRRLVRMVERAHGITGEE